MWIIILIIIILLIAFLWWKSKDAKERQAAADKAQIERVKMEREKAARQQQVPQERTLKKEHFVVAGTSYHKTAIQKLAKANPDWRKGGNTLVEEGKVMERIPHYIYVDRPIKLEPEPTNSHDRNAIKVIIAGEHVGYISQDENLHVGRILKTSNIKYLTAEFRGGEYKVVSKDGSAVKMDNHIGITLHIGYV